MQIEHGSVDFGDLRLYWAVGTDVGKEREANEDAAQVLPLSGGNSLIVALSDGMGGTAGGRTAADIVVEAILSVAEHDIPQERNERYEKLIVAMHGAQQEIEERIAQDIMLMQMGATGVAALFAHGECLHLYAGDSRLYRFPGDGSTPYQTADHSIVQVLQDLGEITAEEARNHPMSSVLTSCFGGGSKARLTIAPERDSETPSPFLPVNHGDIFLLCSDGLSAEIEYSTLLELVKQHTEPETLATACIDAALAEGGQDNITVIVVRVEG